MWALHFCTLSVLRQEYARFALCCCLFSTCVIWRREWVVITPRPASWMAVCSQAYMHTVRLRLHLWALWERSTCIMTHGNFPCPLTWIPHSIQQGTCSVTRCLISIYWKPCPGDTAGFYIDAFCFDRMMCKTGIDFSLGSWQTPHMWGVWVDWHLFSWEFFFL